MKLQLDTTNKTISIEEQVTFGDLLDTLEELLPNGRWSEYKLITTKTIDWSLYPIYTPQVYPTDNGCPWITSSDKSETNYAINPGVFNISTGE